MLVCEDANTGTPYRMASKGGYPNPSVSDGYTKAYAFDRLTKNDFLLDDYTKNLKEWEAQGGTGIKLLTDINHTRETWTGNSVRFDASGEDILEDLLKIITQGRTLVQNYKPPRRKSM